MAQNIGDATLTFLGDTSQLDQVVARIPAQTEQAMSAAADSVGQVGDAFGDINFELDATASNVPYCGEVIKESMEVAEGSTRQAAGEVGLLGELFGITLPRHVRTFLAELPGVGTALQAAFAATATVFIVEALAKAAEKMSAFIADTFIYTDAMKESMTATAAMNEQLVKIADATNKAKTELADYGLTADQKTKASIENLSKAINDNAFAMTASGVKIEQLKGEQETFGAKVNEMSGGLANTILRWVSWGSAIDTSTGLLVDNRKEIEQNQAAFIEAAKRREQLQLEMTLLELQLRDQEDAALKQSLEKQNSYNQALISGKQIVGTALLSLDKARDEAAVAADDQTGIKRLQIEQAYQAASYQLETDGLNKKHAANAQFENQIYQLELANLQNREAVEKTLGAAGVANAAATQVQIEQLTKSHNLKLATDDVEFNSEMESREKKRTAQSVQNYADMMAKVHDIMRQGVETISSDATWSPLEKQAIKTATDIEKAFATLGITPTEQLKKALKEAGDAYTTLSKTGVASSHDLALAQLAVLNAQLQVNRALGDQTAIKANQKDIDDLTKSLQKWEGETVKSEKLWDLMTADFKKKAKDMGTENQQLAKILGDGAAAMQQAFESAIAAALLSQKSFGEALKEATASVLAEIAAQAAIHALYELALALASLAVGDYAGAGKHAIAAAKFGAVAAVAGVGAHELAGSENQNQGASGSSSSASQPSTASQQPAQQPTSSQNLPKLYSGAIVSQPTVAVVGDNPSGGAGREAIIPLSDPSAMAELARAFGGSGGGHTEYHYYLPGFRFSTADVTKLSRQLSRGAATGRVRMTAADSNRVTRRS